MLCVPGKDFLWRLRQGANAICFLSPNEHGYKLRSSPQPRLVNYLNSTCLSRRSVPSERAGQPRQNIRF